jgi:outer membrane autotransporter protein
MAGIDLYNWKKSFLLGTAFGCSRTHMHWQRDAGKGSIDSLYGASYVNGCTSHFFYNTAFLVGWSRYTGYRNIHFIPINGDDFPTSTTTAKHKNNGYQLAAHLDIGGRFGKRVKVKPFLGCDYLYSNEDGYQDTGAGDLNLDVEQSNADLLRGKAGILFSCVFFNKSWINLASEIGFSVIQERRFDGGEYQASFEGSSCVMDVEGLNPNRTLIAPQAKVSLQSAQTPANRLSCSCEGEFGKRYHTSQVILELSVGF